MTEFEELVIQDIVTWAIKTKAHEKYENYNEMLKDYWNIMLNTDTTIDSMDCDGDSEPFMDWNHSSPQPEVSDLWESDL